MEDELDLTLDNEEITRKDSRIKTLSEKVKLTSEERDTLAKAKEDEALARVNAEKERDFYKNFNQVSAKYQGASEYQDKILEKVNAGYDVEDATISILAKEGKYTPAPQQQEYGNVAGGSATTSLGDMAEKTLATMTQEERRQELFKNEAQVQDLLFGGK